MLDSFKSQPINNATLQNIAADFDVARRAFFKLILEFVYTETFIDPPPRGDAPKSVILQHISQLTPILHDNADIILTVQHGFIGTWSDGYYTDYFGDDGNISPQQQEDRQEVYDALINSVPECTMIQVHTWQFKESLTGTQLPITMENAYTCGNGSIASEARTGLHNDCFLASDTDFGTWMNSTVDRPRMSEQSKFSLFGGETCNPNSNRSTCPTAVQELSLFHFTFLNNRYHPDVVEGWRMQGCYDNIAKSLGYRLILVSNRFPGQASPGSEMRFEITLRNDGFTAPVTEMVLKLVLQELGGVSSHSFEFNGSNTNPRFWFGNGTEHTLSGSVFIPTDLSNNTWNVYLAIVDAAANLRETPQYNILAVNQISSMQESRLNNLSRLIVITNSPTTGTDAANSNRLLVPIAVAVASLILVIIIVTMVTLSLAVCLKTRKRIQTTVVMSTNQTTGVTLQDTTAYTDESYYSYPAVNLADTIVAERNEAYAANIVTGGNVAYATNVTGKN